MHILSGRAAREFEAVSDLVLLDMCEGGEGLEPTLLIKTSTLNLKYLSRSSLELQVTTSEDLGIKYSLIILDDSQDPLVLWSQVAVDEEADALSRILSGEPCTAFMFNEWSVPVGWSVLRIASEGESTTPDELLVPLSLTKPWIDVPSHTYYGDTHSIIDLTDSDEGAQQENLAAWLLHRLGRGVTVEASPKVNKGVLEKEITDVLVTWSGGALLVESKALGVLVGPDMPNRQVLRKRAGKSVDKGRRQLEGGVRTLRQLGRVAACTGPNGAPALGAEIVHGAVLVSDLSVLEKSQLPSPMDLQELVGSKGLMWHVLDPHELVRLIQATAYYSDRDRAPAGVVLDALLVKRFEVALKQGPLIRALHGA